MEKDKPKKRYKNTCFAAAHKSIRKYIIIYFYLLAAWNLSLTFCQLIVFQKAAR
jgi:hypothetical protein